MWRLQTDRGQQVWKHTDLPNGKVEPLPPYRPEKNPNAGDNVYRQLQAEPANFKDYTPSELQSLVAKTQREFGLPSDAESSQQLAKLLKGMNYFSAMQMEDGHWPGDYGGPMFLTPGAIITMYVTGCLDELLTPHHKAELIRYMWNHQSPGGGWGLHIEEPCTMFGTVLTYITLRILGVGPDDERMVVARKYIHSKGGAMACPSWGKFWLCVLGVYEWEGVNSLFPELWLFPESLPVHPSRWWCHCRMVYLPMAYCYGTRVVCSLTPLVLELRKELYPIPYDQIPFASHKDTINKEELYTPQTTALKILNVFTNFYEKIHLPYFRKKSCDFLLDYIHAEDNQTNYVDIGPVNKFVNMLSVWAACGPDSEQFKKHKARVHDYLWIAEDGMKCQGYNGSQLWDSAFTLQAFTETGLSSLFTRTIVKGYNYLDISQVLEDVVDREKYYRHISKGGWPFSTRDHGWPISDCTAEGVKATIAIDETGLVPVEKRVITRERLEDAINVLLSFQNKDGGWATYENTRAPAWLEYINPAEVFGGIMIDYSYVECSSASLQALVAFAQRHPDHRRTEVRDSIRRGVEYMKSVQRADGSWYGSWAVCFTYGIWFGVEGLVACGESPQSEEVQRACRFLLSHQNADGGWGESYKSCVTKQYSPKSDGSQVVNTAWAALSLIKAEYYRTDRAPIEKAIRFLLSRQLDNGEWEQEGISGVFNGNCMITYINYRNLFPIWAIGRWLQINKQA